MSGYLLDTNINSETAPGRHGHDNVVVQWLEMRTQSLFVSVITIAEIESGIAFTAHKKNHRKAAALTEWLVVVTDLNVSRILPFDLPTSRVAGQLSGLARELGLAPGFADIAIAATASHNGLTLLTRNLHHFEPLGIDVVDPFTSVLA